MYIFHCCLIYALVAKSLQMPKGLCMLYRLCMRFLPVETVCQARLDQIRTAAKAICTDAFPQDKDSESLKFAVQYEHRASVSLKRADVIDAAVTGVPQASSAYLADVPAWQACCTLPARSLVSGLSGSALRASAHSSQNGGAGQLGVPCTGGSRHLRHACVLQPGRHATNETQQQHQPC